MDHLINNDRKLPPEYNLPHTYVEMQVGEPAGPGLGAGPGEGAALASGGHFPPLAPNLVSLCVSWGAAPPRPHLGLACVAHGEWLNVLKPAPRPSCSPQSLQIAAFLFTVCHVVIVVQDWFTDLSLYR